MIKNDAKISTRNGDSNNNITETVYLDLNTFFTTMKHLFALIPITDIRNLQEKFMQKLFIEIQENIIN